MKMTRLGLPLLVGALALGACSDGVTDGNGSNRLRVQLTDAPGDLKEVFISIDKIVLVKSETDTTGNSRIEITPDTGYINLLALSGGKLLEIADTTGIPDGTYTQMRVYVDEAYIRTNDNRVFATSGAELPSGVTAAGDLKCPSCSQSGLKVFFTNGGLTISENSTVVMDFDAGQSFGHEAGNSGKWVMRPVIRVTAKTVAFGNIKGMVSLASGVTLPACGGGATRLTAFKPFARLNADTLTATPDTLGAYRIGSVTPGTYTMGFAKDVTYTNGDSLTFAATPSVATVTISGDSATANYSITSATCH